MTHRELFKYITNSDIHRPKFIEFYKNKQFDEAVEYVRENISCDENIIEDGVQDFFDWFDELRSKRTKDINTPTCPKCGSTAITTGARGVGFVRGFLGASETVNRCGNCSYTWKPSRWR